MKKWVVWMLAASLLAGCAGSSSASASAGVSSSAGSEEPEETVSYVPEEYCGSWYMESVNTSDGYLLNDFTEEIGELVIKESGAASLRYRNGTEEAVVEKELVFVLQDGPLMSDASQKDHGELRNEKGDVICRAAAEGDRLYVVVTKEAYGTKIEADYYYAKSVPAIETDSTFPGELVQAMSSADQTAAALVWADPVRSVQQWAGKPISYGKPEDTAVLIMALRDDVLVKCLQGMPADAGTWSTERTVFESNLSAGEYIWCNLHVPEGMPDCCLQFITLDGEALEPLTFDGLDASGSLVNVQ